MFRGIRTNGRLGLLLVALSDTLRTLCLHKSTCSPALFSGGGSVSAIKLLQDARSLTDVAHLLGFKPKALAYLIRKMWPTLRYTEFSIPKRSGGVRVISAPNEKLKLLQKRLAKHLHLCEVEIEEKYAVKRRLAHGFKVGQSIFSNANVHKRRSYVLNVDLENFFGSINFGRVRGFFIKNRDFSLNPDVATVLAQIICHDNKLPQGSPCSPVVSNLLSNIMDIRLSKLARAHKCSYTRYADDLTFSTSLREFPVALAEPEAHNPNKWIAGSALVGAVRGCGFSINEKKTRLQYARSRQDVTGVIVNKKLAAPASYRKSLRAMVHRLREFGSYELQTPQLVGGDKSAVVATPGTVRQLHGMLTYAHQAEMWQYKGGSVKGVPLTAVERVFRDFIEYSEFASNSKPLIIFEGKTDSIYIMEALRSMAAKFPRLVAGSATPFRLNVKLFRYGGVASRLFDIDGGTAQLKEFIRKYPSSYRKINGPKGEFPVIIVLDNDDGAKAIISLLKSMFKVDFSTGGQSFHVAENMYVVLSSQIGHKGHCIEDLFDQTTRSVKLSGKAFNPLNSFDTSVEYGKAWFAEKVVKPGSAKIDFTGFEPLLNEIDSVLVKYAALDRPVNKVRN